MSSEGTVAHGIQDILQPAERAFQRAVLSANRFAGSTYSGWVFKPWGP